MSLYETKHLGEIPTWSCLNISSYEEFTAIHVCKYVSFAVRRMVTFCCWKMRGCIIHVSLFPLALFSTELKNYKENDTA